MSSAAAQAPAAEEEESGSSFPTQRIKQRCRTPTVLQMEAVECGAAALGIILGYHGRIVPLEELRLACGVSRDGSKASNMVKAAVRYRLIGRGYKREPQGLVDMDLPFIVFWNFNHFLVVEGWKLTGNPRTSWVFLNDPASGPRKVTWEEFDKGFTGVVLTFEKTPEFQPGGHKRSIIGGLQRRFTGMELPLAFLVLVGLFLVIPGLVIPTFSRVFIDDYLMQGAKNVVFPLLVGLALSAGLQALLTWLQGWYLLRMQTKLAVRETGNFTWHILRLPVEFFSQRYGGEIASRTAINDHVASILSGELAQAVIGVLTVGFYVLLMLQYNVTLTLIGISIAIVNMIVLRAISRLRIDLASRMVMESGKLAGVAMGGLQNIETLKASGDESDFFSRWSGYQAKLVNSQQELARLTQPLSLVPSLLSSINSLAILGYGGYLVMTSGSFTLGMLVAFQSLMGSFIAPFTTLVNLGGSLQELEGDMNRLDDIFNYKLDKDLIREEQADAERAARPADQPARIIRLDGHLEIKGLTFGYSRLAPPLIENLHLSARPGQRIALVGASGSGKSTVAKLVSGLYQPWAGEILFDGKPRQAWPRAFFSDEIAMVDQDIFLFAGTIRENLTMWDSTVPLEDLIGAAKDACIHDDIAVRGGGYDGPVEEMGFNFSGGQRQRLEIARALVRGPRILVLDEATSALDPKTENELDENLRRRGCTCLIIAHRLSTIRDSDEIIVLSQGKVVERGTHDTLKDRGGEYARLIRTY